MQFTRLLTVDEVRKRYYRFCWGLVLFHSSMWPFTPRHGVLYAESDIRAYLGLGEP